MAAPAAAAAPPAPPPPNVPPGPNAAAAAQHPLFLAFAAAAVPGSPGFAQFSAWLRGNQPVLAKLAIACGPRQRGVPMQHHRDNGVCTAISAIIVKFFEAMGLSRFLQRFLLSDPKHTVSSSPALLRDLRITLGLPQDADVYGPVPAAGIGVEFRCLASSPGAGRPSTCGAREGRYVSWSRATSKAPIPFECDIALQILDDLQRMLEHCSTCRHGKHLASELDSTGNVTFDAMFLEVEQLHFRFEQAAGRLPATMTAAQVRTPRGTQWCDQILHPTINTATISHATEWLRALQAAAMTRRIHDELNNNNVPPRLLLPAVRDSDRSNRFLDIAFDVSNVNPLPVGLVDSTLNCALMYASLKCAHRKCDQTPWSVALDMFTAQQRAQSTIMDVAQELGEHIAVGCPHGQTVRYPAIGNWPALHTTLLTLRDNAERPRLPVTRIDRQLAVVPVNAMTSVDAYRIIEQHSDLAHLHAILRVCSLRFLPSAGKLLSRCALCNTHSSSNNAAASKDGWLCQVAVHVDAKYDKDKHFILKVVELLEGVVAHYQGRVTVDGGGCVHYAKNLQTENDSGITPPQLDDMRKVIRVAKELRETLDLPSEWMSCKKVNDFLAAENPHLARLIVATAGIKTGSVELRCRPPKSDRQVPLSTCSNVRPHAFAEGGVDRYLGCYCKNMIDKQFKLEALFGRCFVHLRDCHDVPDSEKDATGESEFSRTLAAAKKRHDALAEAQQEPKPKPPLVTPDDFARELAAMGVDYEQTIGRRLRSPEFEDV